MKNNKETNDSPVPRKEGIGWTLKILIIVGIVVIVGAIYLGIQSANANPIMQATQLNGYFIDVNGDGKLDYVVSSEVIINTGNLNLSPTP